MNALIPLVLATFASGTQSYVFAGLLSEIAADLGVTVGTAGLIAASFAVTFAIAAPFAALIAGRIERRRVLVGALVATAIVNGVAALVPDFTSLVGLRVLAAVAAAFINPIASATAVLLVPAERRGRALALVTAGLTVAFTLGIPVGSVIGGEFGWRATFLFAGLLALVAALAVQAMLPRVPAPPQTRQSFAGIVSERRVLSSFALTFLGFAATFTVVAFVGPVVNAVTGLSGGAVGPFQVCVGIGSLIGVVVGGRVADAHHVRAALLAIFGVMTVTLSAYSALLANPGAIGSEIMLAVVILVGAAALFTLMPLIQVRLAKAAPAAGPLLFGLNATMIFAGQGAGALLGGLVTDTLGFVAIGIAGGVLALAAALVTLFTVHPEPTVQAVEQPQ
jgi:DHA1 family inner membrane transport protein